MRLGINQKGSMREFSGVMKVLYLDWNTGYTGYTCYQNLFNYTFKVFDFTRCKFFPYVIFYHIKGENKGIKYVW